MTTAEKRLGLRLPDDGVKGLQRARLKWGDCGNGFEGIGFSCGGVAQGAGLAAETRARGGMLGHGPSG